MGRYLESDLTALSLEVRRGDGFTGLFASGSNPDLRHAVDHALQTVHSLPVDPSTMAGVGEPPRADGPADRSKRSRCKIQPPAHTPDSSPPALAGRLRPIELACSSGSEHRRVAMTLAQKLLADRALSPSRRGRSPGPSRKRPSPTRAGTLPGSSACSAPRRQTVEDGHDGRRDVRVREGASGGERGRERHRRGDYASGGFPRVLSPPTGPGGDRGDAHERGREGPDAQRAGRGRVVALRGSVRARGG